jgi:tetratricopeptide (TPR) repeat protein
VSNRVEKLKRQARQQEDRRNWVAAIELYGKAVSAAADDGLSPSEVGIYNRIGDLYLKLDDVSQAVYHYLKAVDEYAEAEMYPPAVALCRKILRVAPDQIDAYRKLARLHAATGLMADARKEFDRYLEGVRESGEVRSALEGLDEVARALMNGQFDAGAFRSLREDGDHEEAFDLLLETWASTDLEAEAPEAEEEAGRDAGHGAAPAADGDGAGAVEPDEGWAREVVRGLEDEGAEETEAGAGDAGDEPGPAETTGTTPRSRAAEVAAANEDVEATDAALELAAEFGIDLSGLDGSGQGGRILKADVEAALVRGIEAGPSAASASPAERGGDEEPAEVGAGAGAERPAAGDDGDVPAEPVLDADLSPLAREPRVEPAAARHAVEAYEPPALVAPVVLDGIAPLARSPRVGASAAREALGAYETPLVVAPVTAEEDLASLARRPHVAVAAALEALQAYEAPLVVAPVELEGVAPLARSPRVGAAAAREALGAYETPLVVAPVTAATLAALARRPAVEPAGAREALRAYEPPLVVAPVVLEGIAPLARSPRVEPAAARRALEAYEPPVVVAPAAVGTAAPLPLGPRVEPAAAAEALAAYEPPLVVAPVVLDGIAPLARRPRVGPAAAREALETYEAPIAVAPVAVEAPAPLARAPRVDTAAAREALEAHEPPVVVAPLTADDLAVLALEPHAEAAAARDAVEAFEPPLVLAPVTLDELAPPPRRPRVTAEQARDAVNAFEPSDEMKALADATFQLIGLGPRGPEQASATEVSSSPARDAGDAPTDDGDAPRTDAPADRPEPAAAGAPAPGDGAADDAPSAADTPADDGEADDGARVDERAGGEDASRPDEPVPAAWTGERHDEDELPDFTQLLDEIGWLGAGSREGGGTGSNGNGRRPFDVRVPADRNGHGGGNGSAVPDDPRLKKTLAPWAVESRDVLLSGDDGEGGDARPEDLDFTELLKEVGWLQGREKSA